MAGEWRETQLSEVAVIASGKRPTVVSKNPTPTCQVPVVGGGGPSGFTDKALYDGHILITGRVGTLGKLFAPSGPCWPSDNALVIQPRSSRTDAVFLRYALQLVISEAAGMNRGAANPLITQGDLGRLAIAHPPLPEQRAIAHILGTLDDKIELNRRMSETLEAMARALFKAWFVDFEPVRAKMEGRWQRGQSLPGLPAHLYDLFPARLVDSELGEIPEGWMIGKLGDVAENPRRGIQPNCIAPNTPYIALEHMPRRSIALFDWGTAEGIESNKFEFKKGEILFGKLRPYFHKVGVAPVDGVCSTDIVVIVPRQHVWTAFVLGHVSSLEFVDYTNAGSSGTKMPRTSWGDMARYEIVLPPESVAETFNTLVQPLIEQIISGIHESRTLAALRDALLPKLIRGEIRVKEVEQLVLQHVSNTQKED
jgi:type I restriction enzyme S subunit